MPLYVLNTPARTPAVLLPSRVHQWKSFWLQQSPSFCSIFSISGTWLLGCLEALWKLVCLFVSDSFAVLPKCSSSISDRQSAAIQSFVGFCFEVQEHKQPFHAQCFNPSQKPLVLLECILASRESSRISITTSIRDANKPRNGMPTNLEKSQGKILFEFL